MSEMNATRLDRLLQAARNCRVVSVSAPSEDGLKRVDATFAHK
jgi:hypothetical protein